MVAPAAALVVATLTAVAFPADAAPLDGAADECAIQRALLGKAGPDCPPAPGPASASATAPVLVPSVVNPPPVTSPPVTSPSVTPPPIARPPDVAAPPPPPLPAQPLSPPSPAAAAAERGTDFLILFEFGSEKISPVSEALLKRIATVMNAPAAANARFHIVGHTDGVGSSASNMALSQRRAAAVKAWLTATGGVAAHRLEASGKGKEKLADPAHPQAPTNRRVEIITRP